MSSLIYSIPHVFCILITDKSVESDSSNSQVILDHTVYGCIYVTPVSKQATYFQKKLFSYYDWSHQDMKKQNWEAYI